MQWGNGISNQSLGLLTISKKQRKQNSDFLNICSSLSAGAVLPSGTKGFFLTGAYSHTCGKIRQNHPCASIFYCNQRAMFGVFTKAFSVGFENPFPNFTNVFSVGSENLFSDFGCTVLGENYISIFIQGLFLAQADARSKCCLAINCLSAVGQIKTPSQCLICGSGIMDHLSLSHNHWRNSASHVLFRDNGIAIPLS